jgi:hypothetical protein
MDQLKVHLVNASGYTGLEFWVNERPLVDWINAERSKPLSAYSVPGRDDLDWLLRETGPWQIGEDLPSGSWRYEQDDDYIPGGNEVESNGVSIYSRELLYPALLICCCGMEGCWCIQCRIELTSDRAVWTDFRESGAISHKYTFQFEFDLRAYRAEVERVRKKQS